MIKVRSWSGYYELGFMISPEIDRMGLDLHEFRLFAHLCSQAGLVHENELMTAEAIAEITGMSPDECQGAYKRLLNQGLIQLGVVRDEYGNESKMLFVSNDEIGGLRTGSDHAES
jgi:hypothetical protein